MSQKKVTRRDFVADAGKMAAGAIAATGFPTIVPRHVLGGPGYTPPSALLNIGIVGQRFGIERNGVFAIRRQRGGHHRNACQRR